MTVAQLDDCFVSAAASAELHDVLAGATARGRARALRFSGGHRTADVHRSERGAAAVALALSMLPAEGGGGGEGGAGGEAGAAGDARARRRARGGAGAT